MRLLIVTAMPSETEDVVDLLGLESQTPLAGFFPFYSQVRQSCEIYLVQTHVGSNNAASATTLALEIIKPDMVLKFGCIGANSAGLHKNDLIVPTLFFHSGAWLTRSMNGNRPTNNAALWQQIFGDLPYQNSRDNLGGLPYSFLPDPRLTQHCVDALKQARQPFTSAHLGSGDMVITDRPFMQHIATDILHLKTNEQWCTDNESFAIAQACATFKKPFSGLYFVASSDYDDIDGYDPDSIRAQVRTTILPVLEKLIDQL